MNNHPILTEVLIKGSKKYTKPIQNYKDNKNELNIPGYFTIRLKDYDDKSASIYFIRNNYNLR